MPNAAPGATQRAASKFIIFENFKRLNTAEVRQGLSEAELAWVENLQPIADNNWTSVPGPSPAFASIGQTIKTMFYGVLNGVDYAVALTTLGAGFAVKSDGTVTQFAPNGTFSVAGAVVGGIVQSGPDMTSWEGQRFLFNDQVAGYCFYDGVTFSRQGGISQTITITNGGSNYTSPPAVSFSGGSGSGATAVAILSSPGVVQLVLDAGGAGYSVAPTVNITGGSGGGANATCNIDPRGIIAVTPGASGQYAPINAGLPVNPPIVHLTGGGGSGANIVASLAMDNQGFYFVSGYNFTPGSGYTSAPTLSFTPGANTTQISSPSATCQVGNGGVVSFNFNPATQGGSGYTSNPSVSFSGGGGSGAVAHAIIGGGSVLAINLTNPGHGYLPGDSITVNIGPPAAGGVQATATAKVSPFIPAGTSVAVFQGRVWLNFFVTNPAGGAPQLTGLQWSGTGGWDDWDVAHASGALVLPDADLVHQITGLRAFNNFLWIIGDQSIKQIGNISIGGLTNDETLFTILTLSSDQGTTYLRSCASFNRVFFFVNQNGVYAVFGSSVQKVSNDLDGIFQNCDFTLTPQGALVDMNNTHCVMWLLRYTGFPTGTPRSIFVIFNGQRWFVGSQGDSIAVLTTSCSLASPGWVPVASSGGDVSPIFSSLNTATTVRFRTALTHHGNPVQRKKTVRLGFAMTVPAPATLNAAVLSDETLITFNIVLSATGFQTRTIADPNISGTYLGFNFNANVLTGFTLSNLRIEYQETNIGNQY